MDDHEKEITILKMELEGARAFADGCSEDLRRIRELALEVLLDGEPLDESVHKKQTTRDLVEQACEMTVELADQLARSARDLAEARGALDSIESDHGERMLELHNVRVTLGIALFGAHHDLGTPPPWNDLSTLALAKRLAAKMPRLEMDTFEPNGTSPDPGAAPAPTKGRQLTGWGDNELALACPKCGEWISNPYRNSETLFEDDEKDATCDDCGTVVQVCVHQIHTQFQFSVEMTLEGEDPDDDLEDWNAP